MSYFAPAEAGREARPRQATVVPTGIISLFGFLRKLLSARANRRELRRLAGLEDNYLADIGLSRSDIDWALSQPHSLDATEMLARRVECRRAAKRWAERR